MREAQPHQRELHPARPTCSPHSSQPLAGVNPVGKPVPSSSLPPSRSYASGPSLGTLLGMPVPTPGARLPAQGSATSPCSPWTGRGSKSQHVQAALEHLEWEAGQGWPLTRPSDIPKPSQQREAHSWQYCWRPNPGSI